MSAGQSTRGAAAPRATMRQSRFEDYEQIASLESRFAMHPPAFAEWTHLWLKNPACDAAKWPIGWVVENGEGRIVASLGNIPLPYEFGGEPLLAASGRSLVAEPEYRGAVTLLLDRVINQPGVDLYLNSTVTAQSLGAFAPFECLQVPAGAWDRSAFWITRPGGFARSVVSAKSLPAFCALPLAAALSVRNRFGKQFAAGPPVPVEFCDGFDARFGDFWETFRSAHPNRLLAVRSREVLDWHFLRPRLSGDLWIATVTRGGSLTAYAIFDRRDNRGLSLRRVRLVDFVSLDGSLALLRSILAVALDRCRREKIDILETTGSWLDLAPSQRRLTNWTYFYRASTTSLAKKLAAAEAWIPSLYDGNASL